MGREMFPSLPVEAILGSLHSGNLGKLKDEPFPESLGPSFHLGMMLGCSSLLSWKSQGRTSKDSPGGSQHIPVGGDLSPPDGPTLSSDSRHDFDEDTQQGEVSGLFYFSLSLFCLLLPLFVARCLPELPFSQQFPKDQLWDQTFPCFCAGKVI